MNRWKWVGANNANGAPCEYLYDPEGRIRAYVSSDVIRHGWGVQIWTPGATMWTEVGTFPTEEQAMAVAAAHSRL